MPIKMNTNSLKQNIINVLKSAKITIPSDLKSDGVVSTDIPFINTTDTAKVVSFDSDSVQPKYGNQYSKNKESGIEKIAEAIVNETLSYIVENATVNLKERMDKLESDYNTFLKTLYASALGLLTAPLTPVGSALIAAINSGGGVTRDIITESLKAKNELTDIG